MYGQQDPLIQEVIGTPQGVRPGTQCGTLRTSDRKPEYEVRSVVSVCTEDVWCDRVWGVEGWKVDIVSE